MRVLVTGARGFIGKNVCVRLSEKNVEYIEFVRENSISELGAMISSASAVVHLAGVNRPLDDSYFEEVNVGLTKKLCEAIRLSKKKLPIIFASSTSALNSSLYGQSKLLAEEQLLELGKDFGSPVTIYRLPNVFGKWAAPNYNSVVATFCYNIANGLPIKIHNPEAKVKLVYIDDVIDSFLAVLTEKRQTSGYVEIPSETQITVGELAEEINQFKKAGSGIDIEPVGDGFKRNLFSTYSSYLPPEQFMVPIVQHADQRGMFVEAFRTTNSGQISFFTSGPGVVRGGHYHHSKTEKFIVVFGEACFRFRNILNDDYVEINASADNPQIVQTVPGWAHDVVNIGADKLVCLVWADQIFDPDYPDTISFEVNGNKSKNNNE